MAIIALPANLRAVCTFDIEIPRSSSFSQYSQIQQTIQWNPGRWITRMTIRGCLPVDADAIDAWLYQMRSEQNVSQWSGSTWNRPNGPATLTDFKLSADSQSFMNRDLGNPGYGDTTILTFYEAK